MFKNYFKIALRNIGRQKFYSILNILGLAIGITCSLLIFLYIQTELSYDKFWHKADNIYRLTNENDMGGKIDKYCNAPRPISPAMSEIYPEIKAYTRVCGVNGLYTHTANLFLEQQSITTNKIFAVDSTFFDVFQNQFLYGTEETAFSEQLSIILTESLAERIFGRSDVVGETLSIENAVDVVVSAVISDLPGKTHFEYEALVPWRGGFGAYRQGEENVWYGWQVYQYFLLEDGVDPDELVAKFPDFVEENMKETYDRLNGTSVLGLQPIKSIRLHSDLVWEMYPNSDIIYIYVFSIIAIFLLLIACINYMNLATARSARRSREVGLRKVFGSNRGSLIKQFLMESIIMAVCAAAISLVLAELLLPVFNQITSLDISLNLISNPEYLIGTLLIGLLVGFLAGIYPAFFLSHFKPVNTLKAENTKGTQGSLFRKILIIIQFSISIALIIGTLIVIKQLHYAKNKDLGFNKDYLMAIDVGNPQMYPQIQAFKQELANESNVISAAASFNMPGTTFNRSPVRMETEEGDIQQMSSQFMQIDFEYLETMQMTLKEGRNFSREIENSWAQSVLVNEEAVRKFGWVNPIGKRIVAFTDSLGNDNFAEVVGVVKDFHANSLRQQIYPVIIWLITDDMQFRYRERLRVFVRIKSEGYRKTIDRISEIWSEFSPDEPIQFSFVDDQLNQLYQGEEKLIILFSYFTFITIFIACLGLFGLAAFTAEQRTKEIGIRKVLGCSVLQIVSLLSKDFTKLVGVSFLIACPVSYFVMKGWLQNFAYRASMSLWIFIASGILALLIALITVSVQTLKSATSNPVKALQYE
ncbi:MAG: ABC transporter permease [Candidatus Cloacimonetes bacterium]|nr:ABC transporter permease [Candidatus Cloacimonadota bacterium]MCF7813132.1 ABC transporter permease [Candidatus Cloacimonadota bacterium]MCF7867580.1 ABC transporter permease [Candidatus Cloacimonadota bacterium]MCF7883145.1 ABC transporter permease [Candidatus Cloacimonadota bacterium]